VVRLALRGSRFLWIRALVRRRRPKPAHRPLIPLCYCAKQFPAGSSHKYQGRKLFQTECRNRLSRSRDGRAMYFFVRHLVGRYVSLFGPVRVALARIERIP